jgi:hypothetical protein
MQHMDAAGVRFARESRHVKLCASMYRQGRERAWRCWAGAASAALAIACRSAPIGQAWLEVKSPHFDLYTDLEQTAALDMAHALEESRAVLVRVAWKAASDPQGRTQVAVFADEDRFHQYVPNSDIKGLAQSEVGMERLIATYWDQDRPSGLPRVAVHEITHDLSLWFTPLQPAWYSEGMASFMEGAQYDRATHRAILGEVPPTMSRVLRTPGRSAGSVQQIFDAPVAVSEDAWVTSRFYFTSWLLVHYLMNHQDEPFYHFQLDLAALRNWREAWADRFPKLGPAALDASLEQYLDGGQFNYMVEQVECPAFAPNVRTLSPAEGHGLSAWIGYRLGASELAEKESNTALALQPVELNALRTRYQSLRGPDRAKDRLALARQLVQAYPQSGEAWLLLARSGDSPNERSQALTQARQRMPEHPGVLELLAQAALEAGDATTALQQTDLLIRRTTLSMRVASLHLRALAMNGRCDEARQVARSVAATYPKRCTVTSDGATVSCATYHETLVRAGCPAG